jgi:uncharacterized damage-inducible protein DinB
MNDGSGAESGIRFGIIEPAHIGDERTVLLGFLRRQRELVAWKLQDASDVVLRSVSTASGLTPHGVVRHLSNVERSWLREVFAGEPGLQYDWTDEKPDGEFEVPDEITMSELLAEYVAEAKLCDAVIEAASSLDIVGAERGMSLRWILVHLIEETARHLGQLDVLREEADGSVGEEPTG